MVGQQEMNTLAEAMLGEFARVAFSSLQNTLEMTQAAGDFLGLADDTVLRAEAFSNLVMNDIQVVKVLYYIADHVTDPAFSDLAALTGSIMGKGMGLSDVTLLQFSEEVKRHVAPASR